MFATGSSISVSFCTTETKLLNIINMQIGIAFIAVNLIFELHSLAIRGQSFNIYKQIVELQRIKRTFSSTIIGDQCTTKTNMTGLCTNINRCPSVINDIREGKRNHVVCGYDGLLQIICCPTTQANPSTTPSPISTERVSSLKCNEYKEFGYNKIYVSSNSNSVPVIRKLSNCAFSSIPLILSTLARSREFPHMALIGFRPRNWNIVQWKCGGTLISEQFVLSSGHCSSIMAHGTAQYVRLGELNLSKTDEATPIDFNIIEAIPHPKYRYPKIYNDIALFKLDRNVELNGSIRPACLPEKSEVPLLRFRTPIATGWGSYNSEQNELNELLKINLEIVSQNECNRSYNHNVNELIRTNLNKGIVDETQICAGATSNDQLICLEDLGGPLQFYDETRFCSYTIVGVASFGKRCGVAGVPGIYTRVFAYLSWIERIVWPNE